MLLMWERHRHEGGLLGLMRKHTNSFLCSVFKVVCQGTEHVSSGNSELRAQTDFPDATGPQIWEASCRTLDPQRSGRSKTQASLR